jgi:hypothetical protein
MLSNEQLYQLETDHSRICRVQGKIRPRSAWAPPLPVVQIGAITVNPPPVEPPYECVFRKPKPGEYDVFRANANNESRKAKAQEVLARATIVAVCVGSTPTIAVGSEPATIAAVREAFDRLLQDYPGIAEAAAGEIGELAGLAKEEQEK